MDKYYIIGPFEGDIKISILVEDITEMKCGTIDECKQEFFNCMSKFYSQFDKCYCPESINYIDMIERNISVITVDNAVSLIVNNNSRNDKDPDEFSCIECGYETSAIILEKFNTFSCRKCKRKNKIPNDGKQRVIELSYGTSGGLNSGFDTYLIPVDCIRPIKYDYVLKRKNLHSRYMDSEYELSTKADDRMYDSNIHQSTNNVDDDVAEDDVVEDMSKEF